jgi:ABC-2 type transport system ATP-binding protein
VLLTTHDMREAEALCDSVTLVDHGRAIATEPTATVGALLAHHDRIDATGVPPATLADLRELPGVEAVETLANDTVRVLVADPVASRAVLGLLVESGVTRLSATSPSLEEVYLGLIGRRGMAVRE